MELLDSVFDDTEMRGGAGRDVSEPDTGGIGSDWSGKRSFASRGVSGNSIPLSFRFSSTRPDAAALSCAAPACAAASEVGAAIAMYTNHSIQKYVHESFHVVVTFIIIHYQFHHTK